MCSIRIVNYLFTVAFGTDMIMYDTTATATEFRGHCIVETHVHQNIQGYERACVSLQSMEFLFIRQVIKRKVSILRMSLSYSTLFYEFNGPMLEIFSIG